MASGIYGCSGSAHFVYGSKSNSIELKLIQWKFLILFFDNFLSFQRSKLERSVAIRTVFSGFKSLHRRLLPAQRSKNGV